MDSPAARLLGMSWSRPGAARSRRSRHVDSRSTGARSVSARARTSATWALLSDARRRVALEQRHRLGELAGRVRRVTSPMSIFENAFMIVIFRGRVDTGGMPSRSGGLSSVQVVRSASAAFTAGLAWKAPRTCTEAMAARASSGVTSLAMLARPRTWIWSGVPASRAASRSCARVVRQPELELPARHGLTDRVVLPFELVSNGGADEVGTIGVEAVADHEIHASEIDEAEIDRDFLAVGRLRSQLVNVLPSRLSIRLDVL